MPPRIIRPAEEGAINAQQPDQQPAQQPAQEQSKQKFSVPKPPGYEKGKGPRIIHKAGMDEHTQPGFYDRFKQGFSESASGLLEQAAFGEMEQPTEEPSFWESLIQESGTLYGDAPFMAAGALMGTAIGSYSGNPAVVAGTAAAGTFGFPAFVKQAMREYRDFQNQGGNITFGEYLESAGRIGQSTLTEGAFGVILGEVKKFANLLEKIPAVKNLFSTRYVGGIARAATETGAEVATATGLPGATEGRFPTQEEAARAAILFGAPKAAHLPLQLKGLYNQKQAEGLKYALADEIEDLNLSYPPLQEFKKNENPIYKNNVDLDQNLTAFDLSFIDNLTSKVNTMSPIDYPSADIVGRTIKEELSPVLVEQPGAAIPAGKEPIKPAKAEIPLMNNPFKLALTTISPVAVASDASIGRSIYKQYHKDRAADKKPLTQRYEAQSESVVGIGVNGEDIVPGVQEFIDRFEPGALPGSDSARIVGEARRVLEMFEQRDEEGNFVGYHEVYMDQLMGANRSLKEIPTWDQPRDVVDNISNLTRQIDDLITNTLEDVNPDMASEYVNLNADYSLFKNRYDNKDMRIFHDRTENSEGITERFSGLDNFVQLDQALGGSVEGESVMNLLRRDTMQKQLGNKILNARTEAEFSAALEKISEKDFQNLMEYLTPGQRVIFENNIRHSNNIRQSAIQTEEAYARNTETYERNMEQFRQREKARIERDKEIASGVQVKQDLLVSILKEDPAAIAGNMNTIEGIKRVKESTKKVWGGDQLYDSLAKFETQNMFKFMKEGYLRTGRAPYTELKVQMQNREFRAKLKELNGEKFVKDIDRLVDVSDQLSNNFKETRVKYKDDPGVFNTILQIYSVFGLAQGDLLTPLMAYTAKKNLLKLGKKTQTLWTNKYNFNPEFIEDAIKAARAIRKGNKKEIMRQGQKIAQAQAQLNISR